MTSYRFVEQIDDRLRDDLMELYRHEWWMSQRRDEDVARMLQHSDLVVGVCADPGGQLVGFTRVLTDRVFKALVFDVIVAQPHRHAGLGPTRVDPLLRTVGVHLAWARSQLPADDTRGVRAARLMTMSLPAHAARSSL